jgi:hypothetical protein
MSIAQLVNKGRSKQNISTIVHFVGNHPKRFAELVELLASPSPKVVFAASWAVTNCVQAQPQLAQPHFATLLQAAAQPTASENVKRSVVRSLQFVEIPKRYQGKAADLCFSMLENKKEAVAIRVFSMTVLANICLQNPDLRSEVIALIEADLPYAKPSYLSRGKKVIGQLRRLSHAKD